MPYYKGAFTNRFLSMMSKIMMFWGEGVMACDVMILTTSNSIRPILCCLKVFNL